MSTTQSWHTEPTVQQVEAQIRWEIEGTERGVRRYNEFISNPNVTLADTRPGGSVMRDIMPAVLAGIVSAQAEGRVAIQESTGRASEWWWLIQFAKPEQLAFMTIREALAHNPRVAIGASKRASTAAIHLGGQIQQQMDFERWVDDEKRAVKEARIKKETRTNLFEALKRSAKKIDTRAFNRWSRKINRLADEPWTVEQRLQVGSKLLNILVENGGSWFDMRLIPMMGGKTERYVCLSDIAIEAISDLHTRAEVAQPFFMPMTCRPKAWRRA